MVIDIFIVDFFLCYIEKMFFDVCWVFFRLIVEEYLKENILLLDDLIGSLSR